MLRPLFGGALSCEIPEGFADVSSFRQVPDNQEVFANATTDQCVIVELLQYEESVADAQSAHYFFNEIAQSNGCGPDEVTVLLEEKVDGELAPTDIDAPYTTQLIVGDQRVAKFKEGDHTKNVVRIYLGNIRLPGVTTDVVLSVSAPMRINPASSSRDAFQFENNSEVAAAIFKQALQSFAVRDWSLFR
ncbi:Mog1/PsbP, alpha/beta/alpha sandwich [Phytophthora cactorum]|nr:Mog1/PsbP, alpha/beta/alpha sandwich [Phytophthora cactorum]